jgi:hypothetical protein
VSGDPNGVFGLDRGTGRLTVNRPSELDPVGTPTYALVVMVSDGAQESAAMPVTIHVVPADAIRITAGSASGREGDVFTFVVQRSGDLSGTTAVHYAVEAAGTNPAGPDDFGGAFPADTLNFAANEASRTIQITTVADDSAEEDERFVVRLSLEPANTTTQVLRSSASAEILDDDTPLQVTRLTRTSTGFVVQLNRPIDLAVLNLDANEGPGSLTLSDVTLANSTGQLVPGSLVVADDLSRATFIATGGVLAPDTYELVLRSGDDGWRSTSARTLDGNLDGTPGDSYTTTFMVSAPAAGAVIVGLPDFARGPGQAVNVPATSTGIPLTLSRGLGVTGLDLQLDYDRTLLDVTGFLLQIDAANAAFNPATGRLTISRATSFTDQTGELTVGYFTATVPDTAVYGAKQVLDITALAVFDDGVAPQALPSIDDDAVHIAAYFGDANGGGTYNAPDATLLQRQIAQLSEGLQAYPLADPMLIADVTSNGLLQANDTTSVQRAITQIAVPGIPGLPPGVVPSAPTGADPRLFIPTDLITRAGQTLTVPVRLEVTETGGISISGMDLALAYDAAAFSVSDVRIGSLLDGNALTAFALLTNSATPGRLLVTASSTEGTALLTEGSLGDLLLIDFTVNLAAADGATAINLLANSGSTFTGLFDNDLNELLLNPSVTNADDDSADGIVTIRTQSWQSPTHRCDVNANGFIEPRDVLIVVNNINQKGARPLPVPFTENEQPPPYLDVSGDGILSPNDVLIVINYINQNGAGPVPEGESPPPAGEGESATFALSEEGRTHQVVRRSALAAGFAEPFTMGLGLDFGAPRSNRIAIDADGPSPGVPAPRPAPPAIQAVDRVFGGAHLPAEHFDSYYESLDELLDESPSDARLTRG